MPFVSRNPATGTELGAWPDTTPEGVEAALAAAGLAQGAWARRAFNERAVLLVRAAALLRERVEPLARLMAAEMGKPLPQGRGEVEKCAWVCEH